MSTTVKVGGGDDCPFCGKPMMENKTCRDCKFSRIYEDEIDGSGWCALHTGPSHNFPINQNDKPSDHDCLSFSKFKINIDGNMKNIQSNINLAIEMWKEIYQMLYKIAQESK